MKTYIMPPIPPDMSGMEPLSFFGRSAMQASVVSISLAMEAAFCRALRVTLVGSTELDQVREWKRRRDQRVKKLRQWDG